MATFQQRGKTWQYTISSYTEGKYTPIRKGGFRTKGEAKKAADIIEGELAQGVSPVLNKDIFADYFEVWVKDLKSAKAEVTYNRYLNTHKTIVEELGGITLQDMTKRKYQRFLNEYGETRAYATIRKLNTHIRACVKDAVDEGRIRVDFTRGVEFNSKVESKTSEERHLNYEESVMLIKELKKRLDKSLGYYILLLAATTGMRFAELCGLKRSDFDFKKGVIHVRQAWDYKKGTGFAPLKNTQSKRDVAVDKVTMEIFKNLFQKLPTNVHGAVFFNPQSSKGTLSNEAINKLLRNTLKSLKIDPITIHGLRHTHISVLLYKGVSVQFVSERAGHKDVETTLKYYSHVLKEMRKEEEEKSVRIITEMQSNAV
ncbi:site-specific integrase [Sporosarcina sp. P18a]|uniref:site-specific integrase n=1 Tax=Sporosarcina sp. P18a TaxID=2048259 RepID=UPI000C163088|nr:tyrosine-type recombinase/integrase [Sporosarcina sp. P18a]PIC80511.1 site-specific integrase [Sporosarcina sp. P18a]